MWKRFCIYHGVEARAEVVRGNEDVVRAPGPVPKRVLGGDDVDGGGDEGAGVTDGREAIDRAEVAGDVNWDEEEVSLIRVKRPYIAGQQGSVYGDLRRE